MNWLARGWELEEWGEGARRGEEAKERKKTALVGNSQKDCCRLPNWDDISVVPGTGIIQGERGEGKDVRSSAEEFLEEQWGAIGPDGEQESPILREGVSNNSRQLPTDEGEKSNIWTLRNFSSLAG